MGAGALNLPDGRRIAYRRTAGRGPGVVFLGGFRSDMTGTKAQFLEAWARARGQAYLRFDYTGHGASSGDFRDGSASATGRATRRTRSRALTEGPQVLVGSSMGGWIALLLARPDAGADRRAGRHRGGAGLHRGRDVGRLRRGGAARGSQAEGRMEIPSEYDDAPYPITRRLIEDGRRHLVLRAPLELPFPVRLLHGTADRDVDPAVALRLLGHAAGPDIRLTLVKDADHRFSAPENLELLARTLDDLI